MLFAENESNFILKCQTVTSKGNYWPDVQGLTWGMEGIKTINIEKMSQNQATPCAHDTGGVNNKEFVTN